MPVTFFAHQVPVLPIARRWPNRTDGIALVIGSMAPDMAYFLNGSRLSVWAHSFPAVVTFCVPITLAASWLIARAISPVLWDHLPTAGPFRLKDYRGMSVHRFSWGWAALSAFIGSLSHVILDHFTHDWGWFARNLDWYDSVVINNLFGRQWTVFRIAQYIGHVVGILTCVWMLGRYGRERWMATEAARVEPFPVTTRSTLALAGAATIGIAVGCAWVLSDRAGQATDIIRVSGVCFVFVTATSTVLQLVRSRGRAVTRLPWRA
jgi:Domain of unknown function (DUF4184)